MLQIAMYISIFQIFPLFFVVILPLMLNHPQTFHTLPGLNHIFSVFFSMFNVESALMVSINRWLLLEDINELCIEQNDLLTPWSASIDGRCCWKTLMNCVSNRMIINRWLLLKDINPRTAGGW